MINFGVYEQGDVFRNSYDEILDKLQHKKKIKYIYLITAFIEIDN